MTSAKDLIDNYSTYVELREHFMEEFFEFVQWEIPDKIKYEASSDDRDNHNEVFGYNRAIDNVYEALNRAAKHGFTLDR